MAGRRIEDGFRKKQRAGRERIAQHFIPPGVPGFEEAGGFSGSASKSSPASRLSSRAREASISPALLPDLRSRSTDRLAFSTAVHTDCDIFLIDAPLAEADIARLSAEPPAAIEQAVARASGRA